METAFHSQDKMTKIVSLCNSERTPCPELSGLQGASIFVIRCCFGFRYSNFNWNTCENSSHIENHREFFVDVVAQALKLYGGFIAVILRLC
jgi:hypothetical protein